MTQFWLKQLFTPPLTNDAPGNLVTRQLYYVLLFGISGTLVYTAVQSLLNGLGSGGYAFLLALCLFELFLFWMLRLRQERMVAICLLLTAYVGLMVLLFFDRGLQNSAIFAAPLLLILTSIFLGGDETAGLCALFVIGFGGLFLAEHLSLMANRPASPTSLNALTIIIVTMLLITLYMRMTLNQIAQSVAQTNALVDDEVYTNELSRKIRVAFKQRTQELSTLSQHLQATQRQLVEAEKMAALGSLVAGVAHEINTPIGVGVTAATTLATETEEIRKKYANGGLKRSALEEYLDLATQSSQMITANLQRAAELVQSFKQVAVDQTSMEQRIFSVKKYLTEVVRSLEPTLKRRNLTIAIIGDGSVRINSFPGDLAQIITNLVMNSTLHGYAEGESGHLQLRFETDEKRLRLEYTDDGCGIPAENLPLIFDPFFTTARHRGGTGLGLHIVYNLITQKMQGTIRCASSPGQGVRFVIKLPLAVGHTDIPLDTTEFEAMIKNSG